MIVYFISPDFSPLPDALKFLRQYGIITRADVASIIPERATVSLFRLLPFQLAFGFLARFFKTIKERSESEYTFAS